MKLKLTGFTLIELMIVIVIIAILAMVAVPSYQEYISKGKRSDGKAFLLDLASRQERFYTQFSSYSPLVVKADGCAGANCGLGLSQATSPENYYTVVLTTVPNGCSPGATLCTGFVLSATPVNWTDDKCNVLTLTHTATRGRSGSQTVDYCWR